MEFDGCDEVQPLLFFVFILFFCLPFLIERHRWPERRPVFTNSHNDEGDAPEEAEKYIEVAATCGKS